MISYNIEAIDIIKEQKNIYIVINGWVYSESKIDINVLMNNKPVKTDIEWIPREDVNLNFNQNDKESRGFSLKYEYSKKEFEISFSNEKNEMEVYSINDLRDKVASFKYKNSILKYVNVHNLKTFSEYIKVWGFKNTFKKIYDKIKKSENKDKLDKVELFSYSYQYKEVDIPAEWIEIQKYKPTFGIIIKISEWKSEYNEGLYSLINQKYKNFKLLFILQNKNIKQTIDCILKDAPIDYLYIDDKLYVNDIEVDYILEISLYDVLCTTALSHMVESINNKLRPEIIYSDYDNFEIIDNYFTRIRKNKIIIEQITLNTIIRGAWALKYRKDSIMDLPGAVRERLINIAPDKLCYIEKVLLHRRLIKSDLNKNTVKTLAFYLPQFHCFPENDKWWGKGFTEWVNVKRAIPMFNNHNQPRVPGNLGYYDLMNEDDIQLKQIELAKEYGITGFCYYFYWFNGKRLLEKPLNKILENKSLDFPFCICWANENWTRRWDGLQNEILMEQIHEEDSDERFVKDIINIIKDERYIKINNKPLILIYKIALLENGKKTIEMWRKEVKKYGISDLFVAIVKQPGVTSLEQYNADAMVEFPPHEMDVKEITSLFSTREEFKGYIYDYSELANRDFEQQSYSLLKGCMLQWDNTARRMENANIFENFSLDDYKRWLLLNKEYEILFNKEYERVMFINAWNEWAEGTYLEPDQKYGNEILNITKYILESR